MKYYWALFFVVVLSVSAAAETAYDRYVSAGRSSLDQKDYSAAEESFRAALKEKPDDYDATLYLGITLSRKGVKEGESVLKKALLMDPADPRPNLQLGVYYLNKRVYPEAKDYFENTIELAPAGEYSAEARNYLQSIGKRESRPWRLDAALGIQYDSNVILGADNVPLPGGISRKSDWSALAYFKGQYDVISARKFKGTLSYSLYQSLHAKLSDFNITTQAAGFDAVYELSSRFSLKGNYTFEYVHVGGKGYDYAHTVTPAIVANEGRGFATAVYYSYGKSHFMDDEMFLGNSDRTGSHNLIGITQYLPLGGAGEARVGYAHDRDSTRKDFWAYRGNKGFADLAIRPIEGLVADLYGEYYDKNYIGINSSISGNARHDRVYTYSLTLTKKLSDRFSVVLGQLFVRNKSNIDVFDYKRAITSVFLTARF